MFRRKRSIEAVTVVAAGACFDGELRSEGSVHVDGKVQGSIEAGGTLSIGPGGIVFGDLKAEEVTIGGRVEGTVVATTRLHMLASGRVQGDARYGSLQVEHGGLIQGRAMPIGGGAAAALPSRTLSADDAVVELTPLPAAPARTFESTPIPTPTPAPTPTPLPALTPLGARRHSTPPPAPRPSTEPAASAPEAREASAARESVPPPSPSAPSTQPGMPAASATAPSNGAARPRAPTPAADKSARTTIV